MANDEIGVYCYKSYPEFEFDKVDDDGLIYYEYTHNLAPEDEDELSVDTLVNTLNAEIKGLNRFKAMLNYANKKGLEVKCQYDFYWKDRDLLVRIVVAGGDTRMKPKLT